MTRFHTLSTFLILFFSCYIGFANDCVVCSNVSPSHPNQCYSEEVNCDPKHKLDVYVKPGTTGSNPLVIFIHGGGWTDVAVDDKYHNDKGLTLRNDMAYLYDRGFIIASISYRSIIDEDAYPDIVPKDMFPAQVHDVKTAIRYLRRNADSYNIDSTKIGLAGHSAGAHLAALVGTSYRDCYLEGAHLGHAGYSSAVQAVYTFAPPIDLSIPGCNPSACPNSLSLFLGCCLNTNQCSSTILYDVSPLSYINGDEPPFYMVHGTADCTVSPQNSILLNQELLEHNPSENYNLYTPNVSHYPTNFINDNNHNSTIYNFFNTKLNTSFDSNLWEVIPNVYVVETKSNLIASCGTPDGRLVLQFDNGVQNNITIEGYTVAQAVSQFSSVIAFDADGDLVIKDRPAVEFTIRNIGTGQSGDVVIQDGCCTNSTDITPNIQLIDCKSYLFSKKVSPCNRAGGTVVACMPKSYLNAASIENFPISTLLNLASGDFYLDIDGDFVMTNRIPATYTFAKGTESGDVEVLNNCTTSSREGESYANINELDHSLGLSVMPNPASSSIMLEVANGIEAIQAIEILNLNGQVLMQIWQNNQGQKVYSTDISGLETGMYVVRVSHELGMETTKFLKY